MIIIRRIMIIVFLFVILGSFSQPVFSRENVTDWYIKDFQTEIKVNYDSSLFITEKIIADCGEADNKHGIFRILSKNYKVLDQVLIMPIEIIEVSDFLGNSIPFDIIEDEEIITIKIGDPQVEVKGENNYIIKYQVKNTVFSGGEEFDELYWNLLGNFWELEIDNFTARIIFPEEINQENSKVYHYSGSLDYPDSDLFLYNWVASNILEFKNKKTINSYEGLTVSVSFPKNIITPYVYTPDSINENSWLEIILIIGLLIIGPLVSFLISFVLWYRHGRDLKLNKTITPEFEIPENLSPLEMGGVMKGGGFDRKFITAAIIQLAVLGYLKIQVAKDDDLEKYKFIRTAKDVGSDLSEVEVVLLNKLFLLEKKEIALVDLKNKFYKFIPEISKELVVGLIKKGLIVKKGLALKPKMITAGSFLIFISFYFFSWLLIVSLVLIVSAAPLIIFGIFMNRRTRRGAELNLRIEGFRLYLETVEKYRARFQEQENILEKLLPYTILFGITDGWLKKMKLIYSEEGARDYRPVWLGTGTMASGAYNFYSSFNKITQGISANIYLASSGSIRGGSRGVSTYISRSSSGSSGSGFVGGGRGGGGGGGW